ncbi:MAG: GNAT family N-acetyltransferase [Clostridia bacterium]|nr:GNAT family N-acetyltransferase [Clostridia bacterium]
MKAVLFDLDGTLLNTLDDLAGSVAHAMRQMNLPPRTKDEVRAFVGNGARVLCEKCLGEGAEAAKVDELQALFQAHYKEHLHDATAPYAGIVEMLEALRARGVKRGVVSNKFSAASQAVCDLYFGDLIDIVVGEGPGVRKKPAPDSLLAVMERLGAAPAECAMVGDSPQDILAAKAAGCRSVGVTWGFRSRAELEEAGADVIVTSAEELLAALTSGIGVRFARENELERVNELRRMVNDLHVAGKPEVFKPGFGDDLRNYIYDIWKDENKDIVVAEKNGVVYGYAIIQYVSRGESPFRKAMKYVDVDEFGVDAACRRQGAAMAMIGFIRALAREKGYDRIELNMWEFNQEALAFYEAAGFTTYRRYMEMKP